MKNVDSLLKNDGFIIILAGWSAFHAGDVPSMGWARLTFYNASSLLFEWVLSASADEKVLDSFVLTKDRSES